MVHATTTRPTYHHGDLRNALIAAGAKLAEQGGPTAVGVRAAARVVGVTPTAAYRHFVNADELHGAVKERAFDVLAEGMRTELATMEPTGDAAEDARRRLFAIGRAYLRVALAEPGLFRTAFGEERGSPATARETDASFLILSRSLDDLVATGYLPADRRPLAELDADAREAVLERTLDMVARGL